MSTASRRYNAQRALNEYLLLRGAGDWDEDRDDITDLITDLLFLAARNKKNPEKILEAALTRYSHES